MNHPLASYLKRFFSHYLRYKKGFRPIPQRPTAMR